MTPQGSLCRLAALSAAVLATACAPLPLAAAAPLANEVAPAVDGHAPFAPGEAIVRFEQGATAAERRAARDRAGVAFEEALGIPRAQVVEVDGSVEAAVRRLERQPGVAFAQPNYRYEALVDPPDDTFFSSLWGLSDPASPDPGVSALSAWDVTRGRGAGGIAEVIAIVDTGVDLTHPDLEGNLWDNPIPTGGAHGYDFVDDDGNPDDYDFHGTHVAGTAAAIADNAVGIAGVAPEAKIMAVRVLDGDGSGTSADIAAGIRYAAVNGAGVINLSLGGPGATDPAMSAAINIAAANEAVVVAAAGNSGTSNDSDPQVPCSLPQANLVCVAALNQSGRLASFSNYGATSVDLAAPGTNILSAKTDYGGHFNDGFEAADLSPTWGTAEFDGGIPWDLSPSAASGDQSATDSLSGRYAPGPAFGLAESQLFTDDPVNLTGERGCRVHFKTRYEIEPPDSDGDLFDWLFAGAVAEGVGVDPAVRPFAGTSFGYPNNFIAEEVSISDLDDRSDVHPIFAMISDELFEFDGAYVDDVRVLCRDATYVNAIASLASYDQPNSGNYVAFQGTSMAAPHVSGVAALVSAAAPTAGATEVVDAILQGVSAMPGAESSRPTATWGIADACQAIAVATRDPSAVCPGSSSPVPPPPPPTPPPAPAAVAPSTVFSSPPAAKKRDRTRPQTRIVKKPAKVTSTPRKRKLISFRFVSSERGSAFLCRIDRGRWHQCYRTLIRWFGLGKHVIRVKARDAAGNVDRTPAVYRFRVKRVR